MVQSQGLYRFSSSTVLPFLFQGPLLELNTKKKEVNSGDTGRSCYNTEHRYSSQHPEFTSSLTLIGGVTGSTFSAPLENAPTLSTAVRLSSTQHDKCTTMQWHADVAELSGPDGNPEPSTLNSRSYPWNAQLQILNQAFNDGHTTLVALKALARHLQLLHPCVGAIPLDPKP